MNISNATSTNSSIDASKNLLQKENTVDKNFEATLKKAYTEKDQKQLKKVCNDFEGMLLGIMYKEMRNTIGKSDLVEESPGKDIFQSMLDDEIVKESSKKGNLGLSDMLFKQLSKQLNNQYVK